MPRLTPASPATGGDFWPYRSRTVSVLATPKYAALQVIWVFSYLFPLVTETHTAVLKIRPVWAEFNRRAVQLPVVRLTQLS